MAGQPATRYPSDAGEFFECMEGEKELRKIILLYKQTFKRGKIHIHLWGGYCLLIQWGKR